MNDFLKKGFLLGLGAAAASKERIDQYVDALLTRGQITPKEAEEMYDSFMKKGEETEERWSAKSKSSLRSMLMDDFGMVSKEEFFSLQERIAVLEKQLKEQQETSTAESGTNSYLKEKQTKNTIQPNKPDPMNDNE